MAKFFKFKWGSGKQVNTAPKKKRDIWTDGRRISHC